MTEPDWDADEPLPATALRDVAVIGGGCYGAFYAGQLAKAVDRGQLTCRSVLVVDRDPDCRFAGGPEARRAELVWMTGAPFSIDSSREPRRPMATRTTPSCRRR